LLEQQDPAGSIGADGLDLGIVAREARALDAPQVDALPIQGRRVVARLDEPGGRRRPIAQRDEGQLATRASPEADARDLTKRHILDAIDPESAVSALHPSLPSAARGS